MVLEGEQVWEALYIRGDMDWLNVVVPGYGLGWVEAHHVGEREQEMLVESGRVGLILNSFETHVGSNRLLQNARANPLGTLLSTIGHRVRSLELRNVREVEFLDAVFSTCSDLEHLDLQGNAFKSPQRATLFRFLRSLSGCQLCSLNLKGISIYDEDTQELAELLKYTLLAPRLQELRLSSSSQNAVGLKMVSDALKENKSLELVELHASFPEKVQDQFSDERNQECVEMTTLPLVHKLAFISTLSNEASGTARAGNIMDRGILELIFELTGFSVQRQILWTK